MANMRGGPLSTPYFPISRWRTSCFECAVGCPLSHELKLNMSSNGKRTRSEKVADDPGTRKQPKLKHGYYSSVAKFQSGTSKMVEPSFAHVPKPDPGALSSGSNSSIEFVRFTRKVVVYSSESSESECKVVEEQEEKVCKPKKKRKKSRKLKSKKAKAQRGVEKYFLNKAEASEATGSSDPTSESQTSLSGFIVSDDALAREVAEIEAKQEAEDSVYKPSVVGCGCTCGLCCCKH